MDGNQGKGHRIEMIRRTPIETNIKDDQMVECNEIFKDDSIVESMTTEKPVNKETTPKMIPESKFRISTQGYSKKSPILSQKSPFLSKKCKATQVSSNYEEQNSLHFADAASRKIDSSNLQEDNSRKKPHLLSESFSSSLNFPAQLRSTDTWQKPPSQEAQNRVQSSRQTEGISKVAMETFPKPLKNEKNEAPSEFNNISVNLPKDTRDTSPPKLVKKPAMFDLLQDKSTVSLKKKSFGGGEGVSRLKPVKASPEVHSSSFVLGTRDRDRSFAKKRHFMNKTPFRAESVNKTFKEDGDFDQEWNTLSPLKLPGSKFRISRKNSKSQNRQSKAKESKGKVELSQISEKKLGSVLSFQKSSSGSSSAKHFSKTFKFDKEEESVMEEEPSSKMKLTNNGQEALQNPSKSSKGSRGSKSKISSKGSKSHRGDPSKTEIIGLINETLNENMTSKQKIAYSKASEKQLFILKTKETVLGGLKKEKCDETENDLKKEEILGPKTSRSKILSQKELDKREALRLKRATLEDENCDDEFKEELDFKSIQENLEKISSKFSNANGGNGNRAREEPNMMIDSEPEPRSVFLGGRLGQKKLQRPTPDKGSAGGLGYFSDGETMGVLKNNLPGVDLSEEEEDKEIDEFPRFSLGVGAKPKKKTLDDADSKKLTTLRIMEEKEGIKNDVLDAEMWSKSNQINKIRSNKKNNNKNELEENMMMDCSDMADRSESEMEEVTFPKSIHSKQANKKKSYPSTTALADLIAKPSVSKFEAAPNNLNTPKETSAFLPKQEAPRVVSPTRSRKQSEGLSPEREPRLTEEDFGPLSTPDEESVDPRALYNPVSGVAGATTEFKRYRYPNGDIYQGMAFGPFKHGQGYLKTKGGSIYKGDFKDDRFHGKGTLVMAEQFFYSGSFRYGDIEGFGTMTYPDGSVYQGLFYQGKRKGQGVVIQNNIVVYNGEFEEDVYHGNGLMQDQLGNIYEGEFREGKKSGLGQLKYANGGGVYRGGFSQNLMHGFGIITYQNGAVYEGEFEKGQKSGKGVYSAGKNLRYEGDFKFDTFHGQGKYTNASGDFYEGSFRKGKKAGEGVLKFANGENYVGEFEDDYPEGLGCFRYIDRSKYTGYFKTGQRSGFGKQEFANGDIFIGVFKSDHPAGKGRYWLKDKRYYEGVFYFMRKEGPDPDKTLADIDQNEEPTVTGTFRIGNIEFWSDFIEGRPFKQPIMFVDSMNSTLEEQDPLIEDLLHTKKGFMFLLRREAYPASNSETK